jgi:hypothetical protein
MTLYYYCSAESFVSIVTNKTIRLSMLSLTNDYLEGQWALRCFEEMCKADEVTKAAAEKLRGMVERGGQIALVAGFCLSEQMDQVSQWRGYAADGAGFGVGFSNERLREYYRDNREFGFSLQRVLYHKEEQEADLAPLLASAKSFVARGALKSQVPSLLDAANSEQWEEEKNRIQKEWRGLHLSLMPMMFRLFVMKNPAFCDEEEWRAMAILISVPGKPQTDQLKLCKYRAAGDRVIPYVDVDLTLVKDGIIEEVVLGPKNITPEPFVRGLLESSGFAAVRIRKSAASYR